MEVSFVFRSDIAWKDAKYAQIWEYLRDEFELTQRFASLDFKLKFVEVWYSILNQSMKLQIPNKDWFSYMNSL